jgi:hypothetical protein
MLMNKYLFLLVIGSLGFLSFIFTGCKKDETGSEHAPVINSVVPLSGTKGTIVTVTGNGFGTDPVKISVLLNGKSVLITELVPNQLKFRVPAKAGTGLVSVVVNGNAASGPMFEFIYTITVSLLSGQPGVAGFANGPAGSALFNTPRGITIDENDNIYVADELNHRIRKVTPGGTAITFAGSDAQGHLDGTSVAAMFNSPHDIDLDRLNGFFYVADKLNHTVRRISTGGDVTTAVGIPGSPGFVDAPGLSARLNSPTGIALEGEQLNLYIADAGNHCIRKMDEFEVVTTFAGSMVDGQQDGVGTAAKFSLPFDITWDSSGYLFVTDQVNNNVRRIVKNTRNVTTVAGVGNPGYLDGPGTQALFNAPSGVASWYNEVMVCDFENNRIRFITPSKMVTTIAGDGTGAFLDGAGAVARFNKPGGIVRDRNGDFYIADTENHCIRKMVVD